MPKLSVTSLLAWTVCPLRGPWTRAEFPRPLCAQRPFLSGRGGRAVLTSLPVCALSPSLEGSDDSSHDLDEVSPVSKSHNTQGSNACQAISPELFLRADAVVSVFVRLSFGSVTVRAPHERRVLVILAHHWHQIVKSAHGTLFHCQSHTLILQSFHSERQRPLLLLVDPQRLCRLGVVQTLGPPPLLLP